ncbi:MAG: PhoH family protein [Myxococcota bacterium]|nr:PhoH family protein [Myxococcota bacterium]
MNERGFPIASSAKKAQAESAPKSTRIEIADNNQIRELCGEGRKNLDAIGRPLGVRIALRGNLLTLSGPSQAREAAENLINEFLVLIERGVQLKPSEMAHSASLVSQGETANVSEFLLDTIVMSSRKRPITPRSPNQKRYVDAIRENDIVFGVGPAGTGKTYLAVAMAVAALQKGEVRRILLTRPAVEAGEKLGFLPGDLADKVNPYLRPLYDALHDMLDHARCARLIEEGTIEVAPLAFMRGRTLNRCFVILDEAQNTTREQMKMFLTRLGSSSKAVVTGDMTQIDLPGGRGSGLRDAKRILSGIQKIPFVEFQPIDVVRHPLVQKIIEAYGRAEAASDEGDGP